MSVALPWSLPLPLYECSPWSGLGRIALIFAGRLLLLRLERRLGAGLFRIVVTHDGMTVEGCCLLSQRTPAPAVPLMPFRLFIGMIGPMIADIGRRAASWLAAWDAQGIHRTGTEGDEAGAEWLAAEAARLGAKVTIEEFEFERLDPFDCFLDIDGERIAGVPVFDAPPSGGPEGVTGRLGETGSDAEIALAELSPRSVYSGEAERLRRSGAHRGFVTVCTGDAPGLGLLNAEQYRSPYGAPALHVSSEARERVFAAAANGAPVRLVAPRRHVSGPGAQCGRRAARSRPFAPAAGRDDAAQLVVAIDGRARRRASCVGSKHCARCSPSRRACDVVFTTNAGHELGHLGLDDFVARRPGWDLSAPIAAGQPGCHYGANLGAAGGAL